MKINRRGHTKDSMAKTGKMIEIANTFGICLTVKILSNLEVVAAKMNEVGGIRMIMNMAVLGIIRAHIHNLPYHRIYQTPRNEYRPATMVEIEQFTMPEKQIDGVAKGKLKFCKPNTSKSNVCLTNSTIVSQNV